MEFCDMCDNMLYMKSNEDKELIKFCKHCDFSKIDSRGGCVKISETMYTEDDLLYNQNVNKYLRYDQTLRRINDEKITCSNAECDTKTKGSDQRVLYIKYHNQNMKYFYVCDHCGNIWR